VKRALALSLVLTACAHTGTTYEGQSVALYFGRQMPDGEVTEEAFAAFEQTEIGPLLPTGYTLFTANGRYREASGVLITEPTFVLVVVLADASEAERVGERLDAIRAAYCARFSQTSVLRVDSPARLSFTP
jgi:hypothetical protein